MSSELKNCSERTRRTKPPQSQRRSRRSHVRLPPACTGIFSCGLMWGSAPYSMDSNMSPRRTRSKACAASCRQPAVSSGPLIIFWPGMASISFLRRRYISVLLPYMGGQGVRAVAMERAMLNAPVRSSYRSPVDRGPRDRCLDRRMVCLRSFRRAQTMES
jgi:hypothetical protein